MIHMNNDNDKIMEYVISHIDECYINMNDTCTLEKYKHEKILSMLKLFFNKKEDISYLNSYNYIKIKSLVMVKTLLYSPLFNFKMCDDLSISRTLFLYDYEQNIKLIIRINDWNAYNTTICHFYNMMNNR